MQHGYERDLKELNVILDRAISLKHPSFVVNDEIESKDINNFGHKISYSPEWGVDYFRLSYEKPKTWDFASFDGLKSVVGKYPRYQVVNEVIGSRYKDLVKKEYKELGARNVLDKILIFDIKGYEKGGFNKILEDLDPETYTAGKYYDPYGDEGVEKLEDAQSRFHNRLMAAIDNKSIVTSILFLNNGSDLFQRITSSFEVRY